MQRANLTLGLWRKNRFRQIVIGGGLRSRKRSGMTEAQALEAYLASRGVPREKMILESDSKDTIGNALWAKEIIKRRRTKDLKGIVVITSKYHRRRALMVFQRVLGPKYAIRIETVEYLLGTMKMLREWIYYVGERCLLPFLLGSKNPRKVLRFWIPRYW